MIKTKKIMLAIIMTAVVSSYGNIAVYAENRNQVYSSNIEVKNYNQLTDELGKALANGATDVKLNLEQSFVEEFRKTDEKYLGQLVTEAGYKSKNDYYINEMNRYGFGVSGKEAAFKFDYFETVEETEKVKIEVKRIIKDIIKPNMSEDEKVKAIHDYIVTHVQYDINGMRDGNEAHTAYSALFTDKAGEPHETVCQGYALLFYKMATEAGLEARIMTGNAFSKSANQKPQPHAWNLIKINDNWYQIDLTWDDPIMNPPNTNYKRYDYFNLSDKEMQKDHTYNNPEKFPKCNTVYSDVVTNEAILKEIGRSKSNKDAVLKKDEEKSKDIIEKNKLDEAKKKLEERKKKLEEDKILKPLKEIKKLQDESKARLIEELKSLEEEKKKSLVEDLKKLEEDKKSQIISDIKKLKEDKISEVIETIEKLAEDDSETLKEDGKKENLIDKIKKIIIEKDIKLPDRKKYIKKDESIYEKNEFINSVLKINGTESKEVLDAKQIIAKASKKEKIQFWGNPNKNHKTELNHNFKINFNKKVSADDLKSKVIIFNKNTGHKVDIDLKLTNEGKTIEINKNQQFNYDNQYVLFISDDLKDSGNNSALNKVIIMEIDC
ncbi:transglutaminase domain-containing protein [Clostridium novyi]|uniref:transglutaminase domain-containing protein n=1 Tax=Clostridium novyi TaxID=1542 RepID=UPI00069F8BB8|nr:transglutaminase domain-containing protein [Clostridium novyi]